MIVLGIDSGSLCTGFGIVEGTGNRQRALTYGTIRNRASTGHAERLTVIHDKLKAVIQQYHPEVLALEGVFMAKNAQSALKLGQVRGAVMITAFAEGLRLMEFSPAEVKAAVTGYGRAEKTQVQHMVKSILGLSEIPEPHDAADALALAICALASGSWSRRVGER
jgi:crossover junction endodeoxyribonuclease RuvC